MALLLTERHSEHMDIDIEYYGEDIEGLILEIEESFGVEFADDEFAHVMTFGELCDGIINKIQLNNTDDCTSQQAFYKLRNAISVALNIDKKGITPDLLLAEILPKQSRRDDVKKIETILGFKLGILSPKLWIEVTLIALFISSFIIAFFSLLIAIIVFVLSIIVLKLAHETGNELDVEIVGDVVKKMTRENYLKSRRNPGTFNKNEMENILIDRFCDYFAEGDDLITRESKIVRKVAD